jgi:hypothetical protein
MSPASGAARSFGVLALMACAPQQADPVAKRAVKQDGDAVRQGQYHRHHYRGLGDERQAGEPQLDTVPPVE